MTDRDADAEKLAGAMPGWKILRSPTGRDFFRRDDSADIFPIPAADAPLGERLAFVGRLCEALGVRLGSASEDLAWERWTVVIRVQIGHSEGGAEYEDHEGSAPDLVHAAIRAAIEARGAT